MMGQTAAAGDHWNWTPGIADNSWVMSAMDYGYMEFDLIGGAHVTVYNAETGETLKYLHAGYRQSYHHLLGCGTAPQFGT